MNASFRGTLRLQRTRNHNHRGRNSILAARFFRNFPEPEASLRVYSGDRDCLRRRGGIGKNRIDSSCRRVAHDSRDREFEYRFRARGRKLPRRAKRTAAAGQPLVLSHGPDQTKQVLVFADRRRSDTKTRGAGQARNRCHCEVACSGNAKNVRLRSPATSTAPGGATRFGWEEYPR